MAKTVTLLEADDIDKNDKLHGSLAAALALATLGLTMGVKEKIAKGMTPSEATDRALKEEVANLLNVITNAGYEVVKREDVPEAFRNALA